MSLALGPRTITGHFHAPRTKTFMPPSNTHPSPAGTSSLLGRIVELIQALDIRLTLSAMLTVATPFSFTPRSTPPTLTCRELSDHFWIMTSKWRWVAHIDQRVRKSARRTRHSRRITVRTE